MARHHTLLMVAATRLTNEAGYVRRLATFHEAAESHAGEALGNQTRHFGFEPDSHAPMASRLVLQATKTAATRPPKSTLRTLASDDYLAGKIGSTSSGHTPRDLDREQKKLLHSAIRVNHAGEVAANWIYRGQLAVFRQDPVLGPLVQRMWDGEKKHLAVMNKLTEQHQVAPSVFTSVGKVAGFGLGVVTALMGKEAAMTCTEAVETVIGEHYDDQLRHLDGLQTSHPSVAILKDLVRELRDDELEHLDTAVEFGSQRAPAHALMSALIETGCEVAVGICKRI